VSKIDFKSSTCAALHSPIKAKVRCRFSGKVKNTSY